MSCLATPATAYHDNATPVLDQGESPRAHWVSYAFSTDGAKVVADFEVYDVRKPIQVGYAIYDEQNKGIFRFTYNSVDGTTGVYLDGTPAGQNVHVDLTQPSPEVPSVRLALTFNGEGVEPVAATYKLLMWSAGSGRRHFHSLRGEAGSSCLGVVSRQDTFIYTARDFRGTATLAGGAGSAAGARANFETRKAMHANGTLVGVFLPLASAADEISVDTPSGSQECPCIFGNFLQDGQNKPFGPGSYTFHDTGAGVAGSEGEIVLAGADARLVGFDATGVQSCGG